MSWNNSNLIRAEWGVSGSYGKTSQEIYSKDLEVPEGMDPVVKVLDEIFKDVRGFGGEDTTIQPGLTVKYCYGDWEFTVERLGSANQV